MTYVITHFWPGATEDRYRGPVQRDGGRRAPSRRSARGTDLPRRRADRRRHPDYGRLGFQGAVRALPSRQADRKHAHRRRRRRPARRARRRDHQSHDGIAHGSKPAWRTPVAMRAEPGPLSSTSALSGVADSPARATTPGLAVVKSSCPIPTAADPASAAAYGAIPVYASPAIASASACGMSKSPRTMRPSRTVQSTVRFRSSSGVSS